MKIEIKNQKLEEDLLDSAIENMQEEQSKGKTGKKVAQAAGFASVAGLGAVAAAAMSQFGEEEVVASIAEETVEEPIEGDNNIASVPGSHGNVASSYSVSGNGQIGDVENVDVEVSEPVVISDEEILIDDSDFDDVAFVEPILDDEVELIQIADSDIHVEPIDIESIIIEDMPMADSDVADVYGMEIDDVNIDMVEIDYNTDQDMAYGDDFSSSVDMF